MGDIYFLIDSLDFQTKLRVCINGLISLFVSKLNVSESLALRGDIIKSGSFLVAPQNAYPQPPVVSNLPLFWGGIFFLESPDLEK